MLEESDILSTENNLIIKDSQISSSNIEDKNDSAHPTTATMNPDVVMVEMITIEPIQHVEVNTESTVEKKTILDNVIPVKVNVENLTSTSIEMEVVESLKELKATVNTESLSTKRKAEESLEQSVDKKIRNEIEVPNENTVVVTMPVSDATTLFTASAAISIPDVPAVTPTSHVEVKLTTVNNSSTSILSNTLHTTSATSSLAPLPSSISSTLPTYPNNFVFTPEHDTLLRDAYQAHSTSMKGGVPDWQKIAEAVAPDVTANQCVLRLVLLTIPNLYTREYHHIENTTNEDGTSSNNSNSNSNNPSNKIFPSPWTPDEDLRLLEMVDALRSHTKNYWSEIAPLFHRSEASCGSRYRGLKNCTLKKGHFSYEEDEMILAMKAENKSFESIGRAIGRPGKRCSERFTKLQCIKKCMTQKDENAPPVDEIVTPIAKNFFETKEDDDRLREGYELYKDKGENNRPDWHKITEYVGNGVNRQQVLRRWAGFLDPGLSELTRGRDWTPEEDANLRRCIEMFRKDSKDGSKVVWAPVRQEMKRPEQDCRNRWRELTEASKKKGHFSTAEDDIIILNVRKGLSWTNIGKLLGRSGKRCSERFKRLAMKPERMTINETGGTESQSLVISSQTTPLQPPHEDDVITMAKLLNPESVTTVTSTISVTNASSVTATATVATTSDLVTTSSSSSSGNIISESTTVPPTTTTLITTTTTTTAPTLKEDNNHHHHMITGFDIDPETLPRIEI